MAKQKAFGGMTIDFSKSTEPLSVVFGAKPLSPPAMNAALWKFIRDHGLQRKDG